MQPSGTFRFGGALMLAAVFFAGFVLVGGEVPQAALGGVLAGLAWLGISYLKGKGS